MHRDQEDALDPAHPALIVVYGATKRKHRPLKGDLVVVGRSHGCDIGLVSPEVAPVHFVLVRLATGWHIRDCSGRATRVNGRAIQLEPLRNGDIIQVGSFSFEAHLPPGSASKPVLSAPATPTAAPAPATPIAAPASPDRLGRSRRRLTELALRLRGRLREHAAAEAELRQRQADLEQLEHRLRTAHQEGQAKTGKSDADRQALAEARSIVETERAKLNTRAQELDHFAQHVQRHEQRLREREADLPKQIEMDRADFEADLTRQRVELQAERREMMEMRQAVQQRQADLEATVAQLQDMVQREREQLHRDREQIVREQDYLDRQRHELLQQRMALERLHAETPGVQPGPASTRDTWYDAGPDRLESARKLLRELAERRKAAEQSEKAPALRLVSNEGMRDEG